ncbi:unnamed protein product [Phyllotreta striolata]|uniref:Uncharacterized protein n=1 Tax=Phyllotreta striolata TaxID=444603 RepID=A0A9N9TXB2_PHYSR|nr:unnamed protein product [Phyllotreta striolata]
MLTLFFYSTKLASTMKHLLLFALFQSILSIKAAAVYEEIKPVPQNSNISPLRSPIFPHQPPQEPPSNEVSPKTDTEIEPSSKTTCYSSGDCQQFFADLLSMNDRKKRELEYLETVATALLDNFLENDAVEDNKGHIQEIARASYSEPLLVTLARYFDKYADKSIKKHTKALIFFLVHVLGKVFGMFKYLLRVISQYGIL